MSEISANVTGRKPYTHHRRHHIDIGHDTLIPRAEFAEKKLGVTDRTARKLKLPTTYIGKVAYVPERASTEIALSNSHRRNQPEKRRRRSA
jgi:hypothetical protein